MGLIEITKQHILDYIAIAFIFVGRVFLSTMSVWAFLIFRQHGASGYVTLAALLGWMWVIWDVYGMYDWKE